MRVGRIVFDHVKGEVRRETMIPVSLAAKTWSDLEDERDRYREALETIAEQCGDDAPPEMNAVQIARQALGPKR